MEKPSEMYEGTDHSSSKSYVHCAAGEQRLIKSAPSDADDTCKDQWPELDLVPWDESIHVS